MTKLFSDETLAHAGLEYQENTLVHFGTPGMKWGQRRAIRREASNARDAQINAARKRGQDRQVTLQRKAVATYAQTTKKGQAAADKAYQKYEKLVLSHPDNITASKMTRGEKVYTGITLGVLGAFTAGYAAIALKATSKL